MSPRNFDLGTTLMPLYLMDAKLSKSQWRGRVAKAVNTYWTGRQTSEATLYSTLKNMNCTMLIPGKCHPLLFNPSGGLHEASRIPVRLGITTGSYILKCNRAIYNQFECDSTCNHCGDADETLISYWNVRPCRNVDN